MYEVQYMGEDNYSILAILEAVVLDIGAFALQVVFWDRSSLKVCSELRFTGAVIVYTLYIESLRKEVGDKSPVAIADIHNLLRRAIRKSVNMSVDDLTFSHHEVFQVTR